MLARKERLHVTVYLALKLVGSFFCSTLFYLLMCGTMDKNTGILNASFRYKKYFFFNCSIISNGWVFFLFLFFFFFPLRRTFSFVIDLLLRPNNGIEDGTHTHPTSITSVHFSDGLSQPAEPALK